MRLPAPLRDLGRVIAAGRDADGLAEPLPGRVFRWFALLRPYLPVLAPVVALLLAMAAYTYLDAYQAGVLPTLIVAVLSTVPLVLVRDRSLAAWRVGWLVALLSGANRMYEESGPWPANPVAILVMLFVLLVVGYRQPPGVLGAAARSRTRDGARWNVRIRRGRRREPLASKGLTFGLRTVSAWTSSRQGQH